MKWNGSLNVVRRSLAWFPRNWGWLKWLLVIAIIVLLYVQNREEIEKLGEREIRWSQLSIGLALCAGSIVLTFVRWYLLVWALEFPFKLRDALRLGFIGYIGNFVGPGSAGGDVVKAVMIAREQKSRRAVAVATILIDRILGLLSLFLVGVVASFAPTNFVKTPGFRPYLIAIWIGAIVGLLGLAIVLHPAVPRSRWLNRLVHLRFVGKIIGELISAVLLYQSKWKILIVAVLIGIVGHFGILSSFYFAGRAVSPPGDIPGYWAHLQFIPMAELFGVMIPTPGGLGALEAAVSHFYEMDGANGANGIFTSVAYRALTIVIAITCSGYYLTARKEIDSALDEAEKEKAEIKPAADDENKSHS